VILKTQDLAVTHYTC